MTHRLQLFTTVARFSEMIEDDSGSMFGTSSGVPSNAEQYHYTLRIYHAYDICYSYLTWRPSVYVSAVVLTFVCTCAFDLYHVRSFGPTLTKNGLGEGSCAESRRGAGVIDRMFKAAGATCDKNIAAASAMKHLKSYLSEGKKKDSVVFGAEGEEKDRVENSIPAYYLNVIEESPNQTTLSWIT
jgi:hypothetical protein